MCALPRVKTLIQLSLSIVYSILTLNKIDPTNLTRELELREREPYELDPVSVNPPTGCELESREREPGELDPVSLSHVGVNPASLTL
jgi:hypothetical protein